MKFLPTPVEGAFVIEVEPHVDERGLFARVWCGREAEAVGLEPSVTQVNVGFSRRAGTIRGMHYQPPPFDEVKVVRCTAGTVYDVVVDLRPESPTHRTWHGVELSPGNRRMLYIPRGCAHGYQTLEDDCEIAYHTSRAYVPEHATGVRYDDPAFGIEWPRAVTLISEGDLGWKPYLHR